MLSNILFGLVAAHMKVYSPVSRGGSGAAELISPCAGFDATPLESANRTKIPVTGFSSLVRVGDANSTFKISFGLGLNPTEFNFVLLDTFYPGNGTNRTTALDFTDIVKGLPDNQPGTLQFYEKATEDLYLCSDVIISSGATASSVSTGSTTGNSTDSDSTAAIPAKTSVAPTSGDQKLVASALTALLFVIAVY